MSSWSFFLTRKVFPFLFHRISNFFFAPSLSHFTFLFSSTVHTHTSHFQSPFFFLLFHSYMRLSPSIFMTQFHNVKEGSREGIEKYMKDLSQMMDGMLDLNRRNQLPDRERAICLKLLLRVTLKVLKSLYSLIIAQCSCYLTCFMTCNHYTTLQCTALHCTHTVHNTTPQLTTLHCIYSALHHTVTKLCIALYATPRIVSLLTTLFHTLLYNVIHIPKPSFYSHNLQSLSTCRRTHSMSKRETRRRAGSPP